MSRTNKSRHRFTLTVIYTLSVALMIFRVDWWWWGEKIHPLLWDWISLPMLYQLGIWMAGTALVFWLCLGVWVKSNQEEDYE